MTKTYDIEPTLPTEVPVPEWGERPDNVEMNLVGKVTGTLHVCAMTTDDVFVEGTLVYRGNAYKIKYIHTNDVGQPKGWWYARNDDERKQADKGGANQMHGVIPQDGTLDYALASAMGEAPKTFVRPLLDAVAATVQRYLVEHREHALTARTAYLRQDANRAADKFNTLAEQAAVALRIYETAMVRFEQARNISNEASLARDL